MDLNVLEVVDGGNDASIFVVPSLGLDDGPIFPVLWVSLGEVSNRRSPDGDP